MTTPVPSTPEPTPSFTVQRALLAFMEQERVRLLLAKKEKNLQQALLSVDCSEGSTDLAWYYAQTQKIIEGNDMKAERLGVAL